VSAEIFVIVISNNGVAMAYDTYVTLTSLYDGGCPVAVSVFGSKCVAGNDIFNTVAEKPEVTCV